VNPRGKGSDGTEIPSSLHGLLDSFVGLTSLRDVDDILQRAVDIALRSTQARHGAAVALDGGKISSSVFEGLTQSEIDALPQLPQGIGVLGDKAFLGVPITLEGVPRGALYLTKPPGHGSFSEEDEFFMKTLAGQTAVALETAHLIGELREQRAITELLERIAVAANEATEVHHALQIAIDSICGHTGWPIGHVYMPSIANPDVLEPTEIWHLREPERFEAFTEITMSTYLKRGEGLPGRVWDQGKALWIEDVTIDEDFPRARQTDDAGVRAGFGIPVIVETDVVGVLEFFMPEAMPRDDQLLEVGTYIGTQLGRVVERKRIEEGLRELDVAKSEFVANAAHELRTPLTTIIGLTEILTKRKASLSEVQLVESMDLLRRQSDRLGVLLTNLLDYSRVEVQGPEFELQRIPLREAVVKALAAAPSPSEVHVDVDIDIDGSLSVMADEVRLEQVLVNLLTNAYRYGGPNISLVGKGENGHVLLSVEDDGAGVDPDVVDHLFEPFTRGSETQMIVGSGLGLAIVHRLVESFGGQIWHEARHPRGTSFKIRLQS
jgi:signal transduction histidine kinase